MKFILCLVLVSLTACSQRLEESKVYTLYRSGSVDETMRLHVATFDADDGSNSESYNRNNCDTIKTLRGEVSEAFKNKYWCEKGYYKE
jgi:hypothetical protein